MMRRFLNLVTVLALLLAALAAPSPGHCAVTITAAYVATAGGGLNPNDPDWNSATQYTVPLDTVISASGMPQMLPSARWRYLKVTVMHDGTSIFFRYQWPDATQDISVADGPLFADAFAMQIPYTGMSSIAMGNQFEPVNMIYWRANLAAPQNIVSGGAGTVQKSPDSATLPISQSQIWANGTWTLVIKRPLSGAASLAGNMVPLARGKYYRITFAQWDGGNQERNGVKLVAGSWQTLFVQ
ncbi:ethylbenzene dehydrogenase-related protein [Geobacter pickeringii]|uniref:Cytochrome c-552/DMSO reductase-like haem-binding domain-containing protein n=1 Tax=Geobacter pickeringii TaxID=345632 RepID=A0A0B5BE03_9BACT|nr:ethylbenzene dehydrogenase-related protein [Geobacter pickeringii]AJE02765.1 hypothetical protein GPICK_04725 [Geobacter pickeringii]